MFNIISFLEQFGGKEYNEDNFTLPCPKCGKSSGHFQVSINPEYKVFHCFKCDYKGGWIKLVSDLKRISYEDAQRIVESYVFTKSTSKKKEYRFVSFPIASIWTDEAWEYLMRRGLTEKYIHEKGVYFCNFGDMYKNRVVFPIGKREAFQARAVDNRNPRYLSSPGIGRFLYGIENIYKAKSIIIVEGIFDQIAVEKVGYDVVASFSKKISQDQILLLKSLEPDEIILMFDGDAWRDTERFFYTLQNNFKNVSIIPVGDKDPSECDDVSYLVSRKVDSIDEFREIQMDMFKSRNVSLCS